MKIKEIKIREEDGSYSDPIPVGTDSQNVDYRDTNVENELDKLNNDNNTNKQNINNLQTNLNTTNTNLDLQTSRIDNLSTLQDGSTTGDAELTDARIDNNGKIFANLGEHLRSYDKLENTQYRYLLKNLYGQIDNFLKRDSFIDYQNGRIIGWNAISGRMYSSKYICVENNKYVILGKLMGKNVTDRKGLAFYSKDKNFISGIQYCSNDFLYTENDYKKIAVPDNAVYMRVSIDNGNLIDDSNSILNYSWIAFENDSDALNTLNLNTENMYGATFWNKYNNDWNNLPDNKIFTAWSTDSETKNSLNQPPKIKNGGCVFTIKQQNTCYDNIGRMQYFLDAQEGILYSRTFWYDDNPHWTEWSYMAGSKECLQMSDILLQSPESFNTIDNNIDNLVVNRFYTIDASNLNLPTISNLPTNLFRGVIITLSGTLHIDNLIGRIQIAYNLYDNEAETGNDNNYGIYYRIYWGGGVYNRRWTEWRSIPTVNQLNNLIEEKINPITKPQLWKTFRRVGCIGDSLASGEVSGIGDLYDRSWGQYMASASGGTYYNFSKGGLEAGTWLTDEKGAPLAFDGNHKCQVYIIGLGVNDRGRGRTLGTIDDVKDDYNQNPNTYYGNLGKIIMKCQEHCPGSKIFILTNPKISATDPWNMAIHDLVNKFNYCYLVDLATDYASEYASGSMLDDLRWSGHYPSIAYYRMSEIIEEAINNIVIDKYIDFKDLDNIIY